MCRWIRPADTPPGTPPDGIIGISPSHHHRPRSKVCCDYGGGWWQWSAESGWKETQAAPVMKLVSDRIDFERAPESGNNDGRYIGSLPGHDPDKWMLHLIRASDPAYPTLLEEEMKWLGEVDSPEDELHRMDASYLLGRYTWALRQIESALVQLFHRTKHASFRREIAHHIRRLYDDIKRHAIKAKGPPSETAERGRPFARYETYHSPEALDSLRSEGHAKALAAEVLGTGTRKRPVNEECAKWTRHEMWPVWEIIMGARNAGRKPELAQHEQNLLKEIDHRKIKWDGFTFPELWAKWLEGYLKEKWESARPLIGGRTHKFELQKPSIVYAAATFWSQELRHFEPDHRQHELEVMARLLEGKKRRWISGK